MLITQGETDVFIFNQGNAYGYDVRHDGHVLHVSVCKIKQVTPCMAE